MLHVLRVLILKGGHLTPLEFFPNSPFDFPNLCSLIAPTPDNSNASLANPNSPLANSNTFSAAFDASPASSKSLGPSSTVPDTSICHQFVIQKNLSSSLQTYKHELWSPSPPPQCQLGSASTALPRSTNNPGKIETMDTQQTCGVTALLDSRAMGLFLDLEFVKCHSLTMQPLPQPILVFNIDGMPNKAGAISSMVDHYQNYAKQAVFAITSLSKQNMILGLTWLWKHNPKVDWAWSKVTMNQYPQRCSACATEVREEHQTEVCEHVAIWACHTSHLPFVDLDLLDPLPLAFLHREALYKNDQSSGGALNKKLGEESGGIHDPEFLDQTTSQQLAQAFVANSMPQAFQDIMPPYLCSAFEDVFFKASFDSLPECKQWDHTIELMLGSKPSSCKVYLLAPKKQDKLNTFLQENLDSRHICPSKSPMASLVLNAMTVKKCYPLLLISELINNLWSAQYFTKLDVWWSYNNMHIQEGDKWKAAFQTNWGLFKPLVMFFGLTNSLATFQTMMNNIFWDLIAKGLVCVYLDDILIYTKTLEEHPSGGLLLQEPECSRV
ncbi:hypothetical protein E4T56_gene8083 [Termitomyces sp. T112]|nr:hypothetical protein E4T56_gene8083 [Termitomyces sp. T112]